MVVNNLKALKFVIFYILLGELEVLNENSLFEKEAAFMERCLVLVTVGNQIWEHILIGNSGKSDPGHILRQSHMLPTLGKQR